MKRNKKKIQIILITIFVCLILISSSAIFLRDEWLQSKNNVTPQSKKEPDNPFDQVYFPNPNCIYDIVWRPQGDWAFVVTESCIFKTPGYTNDYFISLNLLQGNFDDLKKGSWSSDGKRAIIVGSDKILFYNGINFTDISYKLPNFYSLCIYDITYNAREDSFYMVGSVMETETEKQSKGLLLVYDGEKIIKRIYSSGYESLFVDIEFNDNFSFGLIGDKYGRLIKLSTNLELTEIFNNDTVEINDVCFESEYKAFLVGSSLAWKRIDYKDKEDFQKICTGGAFYKIEYSPLNNWTYENLTYKLPNNKVLNYISFTPDNTHAIMLGENKLVLKYDNGDILDLSSSCENLENLYFVSFNPKEKYGLIVGDIRVVSTKESSIIKYENDNFKIIFEGFGSDIIDLSFSNNRNEFVALMGDWPNYVWVVNGNNYSLYADFPSYDLWHHYISHGLKTRVSYSPSGDFALVLDRSRVYKIENKLFTICYNELNCFIDIQWISDTDTAYIVDHNNGIFKFDGNDIKLIYSASGIEGGGLRTLGVSDDGKLAIFGGQSKTIVVKKNEEFKELYIPNPGWPAGDSYIASIIWLPDSYSALIGDQICLWKYENGNLKAFSDMKLKSSMLYRFHNRDYIIIQNEEGIFFYYNSKIIPLDITINGKIYTNSYTDKIYIYSDYLYCCNLTLFEKYLKIDEIL